MVQSYVRLEQHFISHEGWKGSLKISSLSRSNLFLSIEIIPWFTSFTNFLRMNVRRLSTVEIEKWTKKGESERHPIGGESSKRERFLHNSNLWLSLHEWTLFSFPPRSLPLPLLCYFPSSLIHSLTSSHSSFFHSLEKTHPLDKTFSTRSQKLFGGKTRSKLVEFLLKNSEYFQMESSPFTSSNFHVNLLCWITLLILIFIFHKIGFIIWIESRKWINEQQSSSLF